jgi:hypothetical protein
MGVDIQTLRDFRETIQQDIPKFRVGFKDQSALMKVLGFLARPFNGTFMTSYTTTMGNAVYFPTEVFYEDRPDRTLRILSHEYVHLYDGKEHKLFQPSYLFPQILAVIPLIVFAVLAWPYSWLVLLPFVAYVLSAVFALWSRAAFWVSLVVLLGGVGVLGWLLVGWKLLILLGLILPLIPWPAYWRTKWELRGYAMTVGMIVWTHGSCSPEVVTRVATKFVGPDYFFMSWSRKKIEGALTKSCAEAASGALQKTPPYKAVHDFLSQRNLLRR